MAQDAPSVSGAAPGDIEFRQPPHVWRVVAGFVATRLLGNLFVRFPYVFAAQISKGLGVDLSTLTTALGVRELGGLAAPQAGRWVDRGHLARVIVIGGVLAGVSCVVAATPWFPLFVVVMVVGGAAKISVDLAQNAWVGHHVSLDTRGRVIGVVETTWAGAFLAGVPALGWLVDRFGWQWAFIACGPAMAITAVLSGTRLPPDEPLGTVVEVDDAPAVVTPVAVANPRLKRAVWIFCAMQPMAQMLIFAVNGYWFDRELGLSATALGVVISLLGVAELVGTLLAVWITDRLGPIRCGMWGMAITAAPLAAIALAGDHVVAAVSLMLAMDIALEFSFVAVLPMFSELDVDNRGKSVSHVFVLIMVSRAIGSVIAGAIYEAGGFNASIAAATVACIIGAGALRWSRHPTPIRSRSVS